MGSGKEPAMSLCNICDGSLQQIEEPTYYNPRHKVWACGECTEILKTVPAKGENNGDDA